MSESPKDNSENLRSEASQTIADPRQTAFSLPLPPALQSLVELEKQRIESFNRRTDVVKFAIETNDAADRRQFEFQMAKLKADDAAATRRHGLLRTILVGGGVVSIIVVLSLLGMAFFGNPGQSQVALAILTTLGIGTGGYGVIAALASFARKLLRDGGRL